MKIVRVVILLTIVNLTIDCLLAQDEFNWDTIQFEEEYMYLEIDTSEKNIWQIGTPQKDFFNKSYSFTKSIVTDTLNPYPINNHSYFDIKIGEFNYPDYFPYDIFFEFKHKYDTDTLMDGGYITVSYDGGINWLNVIEEPLDYNWPEIPKTKNGNLYNKTDTLFNGENGFSGNSGDWKNTWFAWHYYLVSKSLRYNLDTMVIRFNFISDDISESKEGWMIDDIRLYSVDLGSNTKSIIPFSPIIFPNPTKNQVQIDLGGFYSDIVIELYNINQQKEKSYKYSNKESIKFEIDAMSPGVYFVQFRSKDKLIWTRKLMVIEYFK